MLEFVEQRYWSLLLSREITLIAHYRSLTEPARCLFVRLANRRRSLFRLKRLEYNEIPDLDAAITELETTEFVTRQPQGLLEDKLGWLDCFTLAELRDLFPGQRGQNKAHVMDLILEQHDHAELARILSAYEPVLRLRVEAELRVLKFLFFGSLNRDMEQFVLRDLGQVQFETLDTALVPAYFLSRRHVEDCLQVRLAYLHVQQNTENLSAEDLVRWFFCWRNEHSDLHPDAERLVARLSLRIGLMLERTGQGLAALECYAQAGLPPARERRVRLLCKLNRSPEALALCKEIQAKPRNGAERIFAEDFSAAMTTGRRRRSVTGYLKQAQELVLPTTGQGVEQAVLTHFQDQGWQGYYAENRPWRSLLGLLLWDVMFDEQGGGVINPLQRVPADLWSPDYYSQHQSAMDQALNRLNDAESCWRWLERKLQDKWGIANPLVVWEPLLPDLLQQFLACLQAKQLQTILLDMLSNVRDQAHGFPDLFLRRDDQYEFLEVKSPTDRLSDQQLYWLRRFTELGIKASVIRVRWD